MQFCKKLLGVKKSTQNDFIYGEIGRISDQSSRYYDIIKYWVKLVHSSDNKYIKNVYELLRSDIETQPNCVNWCSLVRDLISTLGFYEIWLYLDVGNVKVFLFNVKQRIRDHFIQGWNGRLQDSSRANFYKNVANFSFQAYLEILTIPKYRISVSRLRVSSHGLYVETGRWRRPHSVPYRVLDDEYHFVLECRILEDLRTKYIPSTYRTRPNMYKLIKIFDCTNKNTVGNLSIFINKAFVIRNNDLL